MLEAEQIFQERYRLVRRLGQRSVRDTWLAVDFMSDPPHDVVIKFLGGGHALDWDHIKLFEREGNVLRSLEHPQIPAYREFFTLEDHGLWFALIQDYIAGMSLAELVQQQSRLAEAQLRQIAEEALAILEYLHEQSPPILHRATSYWA
ncbi:MAG: protein kinase [Cyanobacteria bacterium P01_H01_bin.15]